MNISSQDGKSGSRRGAQLIPGPQLRRPSMTRAKPKSGPKIAEKPTQEMEERIDIPPGTVSSAAAGILTMIFMVLPFYTSSVTITGVGSRFLSLSAYDLAQGAFNYNGTMVGIGMSFPVMWVIAAGAILAVILGVILAINYLGVDPRSTKPLAKRVGVITLIAGLIVTVGSFVAFFEISQVSETLLMPGLILSAAPDYGLFGAIGMGLLIVFEAVRMIRAGD